MGIALTAGMRSNLFNLQATSKLMDQTSMRLNSGKKVNSALDDANSYFTAKSHMSRANDLESLMNGMSEAVQTITAANNGIESITTLLESAKATAEAAKAVEAGTSTTNITQTVTLSDVGANDKITIGGTTYTATAGNDSTGTTFGIGGSDALDAAALATLINSNGASVEVTGISGSTITLEISGTDMTAGSVEIASGDQDVFSEAFTSASTDELSQLKSQYNTLLSQIDQLVDDSGYKGINLLSDTDSDDLVVNFEGTNGLTVEAFDADYTSLSVSSSDWAISGNISSDISSIEDAIDTLESKASSLSSSLSVVTTRQDFTENMINTLTTGADNLTLADMNEEGANMLMLQTQQSLGVNALSLSSQAAQSVLRLF